MPPVCVIVWAPPVAVSDTSPALPSIVPPRLIEPVVEEGDTRSAMLPLTAAARRHARRRDGDEPRIVGGHRPDTVSPKVESTSVKARPP